MKLFNYFSKNIGIDLGRQIRWCMWPAGIVAGPSIAAVNNKTSQILAIGDEAKKWSAARRLI